MMDIFIAEQILRYLFQVCCTDSTKMGTKRVFVFQQKQSYLFLQDIDIILRQNLNLLEFCYNYAHTNFQGEETFI